MSAEPMQALSGLRPPIVSPHVTSLSPLRPVMTALPAPAVQPLVAPPPRSDYGKLALDLLGASLLVVLLAPLMAVVAALVRLTSRGPVLFAQDRMGVDGVPFRVLKFRSMVSDAESLEDTLARERRAGAGPFFKVRDDDRVTTLGRFLRTWSLDELPQLFNVLRGEMSLVGPRPLLVREYHELPPDVRAWRFSMKPGITGLWQVSGRSRTTDASRLRLDRLYVERMSLTDDLAILARTPFAVLRAEGAV